MFPEEINSWKCGAHPVRREILAALLPRNAAADVAIHNPVRGYIQAISDEWIELHSDRHGVTTNQRYECRIARSGWPAHGNDWSPEGTGH